MSKLTDQILDLFYPTKCIFCRTPLSPGRPRLCPVCQEGIRHPANTSLPHISLCVTAVSYEDQAAAAIRRYKFHECSAYAEAFGELTAERIYEELWGRYDLITWAPVSPDRLRQRGYDQARLLAENAASRLRQTAVSTLKKMRRVPQQALAENAEKRRANILGAYSVPKRELVAGKRILLIDDVVTTGATASECAKTLKTAGAAEIFCAALAKTPGKPSSPTG